jgi:large subunit ribosomal protein L34e
MVRPGLRSRSKKRIKRRVPSGVSRIFYVRRKHHKAVCGICGKELSGVPWNHKVIKRGAKTEKRPERPFGGVLCPDCLSTMLKLAARAM